MEGWMSTNGFESVPLKASDARWYDIYIIARVQAIDSATGSDTSSTHRHIATGHLSTVADFEVSERVARGLSLLVPLLAADHIDGTLFAFHMSRGNLLVWLREDNASENQQDWIRAIILDACEMIEVKG